MAIQSSKPRVGRPPTCDCGECKKCKNRIRGREYYRSLSPERRRKLMAGRNMELARQRDRERYQRDREKRIAQLEARDSKKRQATKMVNSRVAAGTMHKPDSCERCGTEGPVQAHHDDYDKPLDVIWLCTSCHGAEHRKPDEELVGWKDAA